MPEDDIDPSLMPVPLHVEFWVELVKRPLVGSLLLGIPLGAAGYILRLPFEPALSGTTPFVIEILGSWIAGALVAGFWLYRPY